MENCVGYVRVSSTKQIENYSLDEQERLIRNYALDNNLIVIKIYREEGKSGKNTDREELQEMLSDLKIGIAKHLIIISTDRFTRSVKDATNIVDNVLIPLNVKLHAVFEHIDITNDSGLTMFQMQAVFAEFERKSFLKRSKMGKTARARKGGWNGGNVATGYKLVNSKLVIDEENATYVRMLFDYFLQGNTLRACTRYMSKIVGHNTQTWANTNVKRMLQNKTYIGYIRFSGKWYKSDHEPLIDLDVFNTVQALIKKREEAYSGKEQGRRYFSKHIFAGLLYCKQCGSKYCYKHNSYSCYSRVKSNIAYINNPNCKNKNYKEDILKNEIFTYLEELDIEKIEYARENKDEKLHALNKSIKSIDSKADKLLELYIDGNISKSILDNKMAKIQQQKDLLDKKLNELENTETKEEQFLNSLSTFRKICRTGDDKKLRTLLDLLVCKIEIDDDDITVFLNI